MKNNGKNAIDIASAIAILQKASNSLYGYKTNTHAAIKAATLLFLEKCIANLYIKIPETNTDNTVTISNALIIVTLKPSIIKNINETKKCVNGE